MKVWKLGKWGAGVKVLTLGAIVGVMVVGAVMWSKNSTECQSPVWMVPADADARIAADPLRRGSDLLERITVAGMTEEDLLSAVADRTLPWAERSGFLRKLAGRAGAVSARRLVSLFLGESPANQGAFARVMAEAGCAGFFHALEALLEDGDDAHAAAAIRGLAGAGGAAALQILDGIMGDDAWPPSLRCEAAVGLLQQGDSDIATLAIDGLSTIGGEESRGVLSRILHDARTAQGLRLRAAAALGRIGSPQAVNDLVAAFAEFPAENEQARLIAALGHCPFPLIERAFRDYLVDPATPDGLRPVAAEALANTSHEALPFLRSLAATDSDPDVREMAAWAISTREPGGQLGPELARMLAHEPEPDVRRRLYEGLLVQAENPAETLLPLMQAEDDPAARVAALNAMGDAVGRGTAAGLAARFDSEMTPELEVVAMGDSSLNLRMRAVFALRRAGTPASQAALSRISLTPTPEIATAAANGLIAQK